MSNGLDSVVGGPVGVLGASGETAAVPLEPVVGVGGLLGGAESGVTAAGPLEQVDGDGGSVDGVGGLHGGAKSGVTAAGPLEQVDGNGGSHGGASGVRQAALELELQQAQGCWPSFKPSFKHRSIPGSRSSYAESRRTLSSTP